MTKLKYLIPGILLMSGCIKAQQSFIYTKTVDAIVLNSDSATITLNNIVKTKSGSYQRLVSVNDRRYFLDISKTKTGKIQQIMDANKTLIATVPMDGNDRYNIILPDNTVLKWKRSDKHHWTYQRDGKDVIYGASEKVKGKRQIILRNTEPELKLNEAVQISTIERGAEIIASSSSTGAMVGVALGLALMRMALASSLNSN